MIFTITGESTKFTGLIHKNKGEDWQEVEPKDYKITGQGQKIEYLGDKDFVQPTYTTDWKKVYDSKAYIPDHIVEEVNKEKPDIVKRIENGKLTGLSRNVYLLAYGKLTYGCCDWEDNMLNVNSERCEPPLNFDEFKTVLDEVRKDEKVIQTSQRTGENDLAYKKSTGCEIDKEKSGDKELCFLTREPVSTPADSILEQLPFLGSEYSSRFHRYGQKIEEPIIEDLSNVTEREIKETLEDKKGFIDNIFKKNDQGKIRPSLIDFNFIEGMAKVLTQAIEKEGYKPNNWKKCDDIQRYEDALMRHLIAYYKGEKKDKKSGLSHLHHAACNLMFLEYFNDK